MAWPVWGVRALNPPKAAHTIREVMATLINVGFLGLLVLIRTFLRDSFFEPKWVP